LDLFTHSVPLFGCLDWTPQKSEKDVKNAIPLFAQLGAFLGKCALPSTKRDGSTGYGGCARIYGRWRRRTALDGNLSHRSYQMLANIPFIWSVAALEHRVLKGKTWHSIGGDLDSTGARYLARSRGSGSQGGTPVWGSGGGGEHDTVVTPEVLQRTASWMIRRVVADNSDLGSALAGQGQGGRGCDWANVHARTQDAGERRRSTTATPASKTRLPSTLDQTILARDGGGSTDGGGSGSGGRQFRLIHHRRKVPPLGRARHSSSRRRLAAFTASSHAESSDDSACFGPKARTHDNPFGHLTRGQNVGKGLRKCGWLLVRPIFLRISWFLNFCDPPFWFT